MARKTPKTAKLTLKEIVGEERLWCVDFDLAGHVYVRARDRDAAAYRARRLSWAYMGEHEVQNMHFGEHYVEDVTGKTDEIETAPEADAWWALHVRGAPFLQAAAQVAFLALRPGATDSDREGARVALRMALRRARHTKADREADKS